MTQHVHESLKILWHEKLRYYEDRVRINLQSALKAKARSHRDVLSIVGAFHNRNVGDVALGHSVAGVARTLGISELQLLDVHKLPGQWNGQPVVVGGGATGVLDNMKRLRQWGVFPGQTAWVGMDFAGDIASWPDEDLNLLRSSKSISVRSRRQCELLTQLLGRDDIHYFADNAFSLIEPTVGRDHQSVQDGRPLLGVNLLPLFMQLVGRQFVPGTALKEYYQRTGSPLFKTMHLLGPAYIKVMRSVVKARIHDGHHVIHIPFAPEDDLFARVVLRDLKVTFRRYDADPFRTAEAVSQCSEFIPTRFHAIVFALAKRVPIRPILYAAKCEDLLSDLGLRPEVCNVQVGGFTRQQLMGIDPEEIDSFLSSTAILLDSDSLVGIRDLAKKGIEVAVQSVCQTNRRELAVGGTG